MITFLEKILIREETSAAKKRQSYGILCGAVGIFLNLLLFLGKLLAGGISHSIAITADAFNNLSDAGSSAVTLAGFKMAGAKPDSEHPFGHGRIEYLSGLIVSAAILFMAFELMANSIEKIMHPVETKFQPLAIGILLASILVKLYMAYYNRRIGLKIGSAAMRATAVDSLSDALSTTIVFLAGLIEHFSGYKIDGYCGVLVGAFIFYAGISSAKETLNPLLGQQPDEEFVNRVLEIVTAKKGVLGAHDLIVHDYGPGRRMLSLHAEVPADAKLLEAHEWIDEVEAELKRELGCEAVIHIDPVVSDERTEGLRRHMRAIVLAMGEGFSMHDFRMVRRKSKTNLIFDVVVPFEEKRSDAEIVAELRKKARKELGEAFSLKVQIDRAYVKL